MASALSYHHFYCDWAARAVEKDGSPPHKNKWNKNKLVIKNSTTKGAKHHNRGLQLKKWIQEQGLPLHRVHHRKCNISSVNSFCPAAVTAAITKCPDFMRMAVSDSMGSTCTGHRSKIIQACRHLIVHIIFLFAVHPIKGQFYSGSFLYN